MKSIKQIQGVWPIKLILQNNSGILGSSVKDNGARLTAGNAIKLEINSFAKILFK